MDRRTARKKIMYHLGEMVEQCNALEGLCIELDQGGDPIPSGELRRHLDKQWDWLDKVYVWAGNV